MEKVLILGGMGHLGSYFIRQLSMVNEMIIAKGGQALDITVVDNFATQRYSSLFNMPGKINFIEADFIDIDPFPYKHIIHLAAITDAASSFANEDKVREVNITKTKEFLSRCLGARVIFPSSTSVYGTGDKIITEDTPVNPQSPYAKSKVEMEEWIKANLKDYIIPRFGTVYGITTGMRFHTAINKFCYQASIGQPLTIWRENYEQKRPYAYLGDVSNFIAYAMTNKDVGIYNVVTDNELLSKIVMYIQSVMRNTYKKEVALNFVDTPLLNQYSYEVDNTKSRQGGFKYHGDIWEQIKKTLELLRNLS